jgi:hypothetical protein
MTGVADVIFGEEPLFADSARVMNVRNDWKGRGVILKQEELLLLMLILRVESVATDWRIIILYLWLCPSVLTTITREVGTMFSFSVIHYLQGTLNHFCSMNEPLIRCYELFNTIGGNDTFESMIVC